MTTALNVFEDLTGSIGRELAAGPWLRVDQDRIDRFGAATDDLQWIHTDPMRAAAGPYGGTVAHGYLTLSLLPVLTAAAVDFRGVRARVNYGLDRVRFPAPLPAGSRIRDRVSLAAVEDTGAGRRRLVLDHVVDVEDGRVPVCVATTITLFVASEAEGTRAA